MRESAQKLSVLGRFYIYALHGYFVEVAFTAGWEFVVNYNWKFPGNTSMWSLLIYGTSMLALETMYQKMRNVVPLPIRALIYVLWTYLWEYACGYVLLQFDACPWNYSQFDYNLHGLITFEYAPAWYVGAIVAEKLIIPLTLQLAWHKPKTK